MKQWCAVGLAMIMLVSIAFSNPSPVVSKYQRSKIADLSHEVRVPADAPGFIPRFGELDIIGDTLIVGTTYWDNQHNGTVGRMIGYTPNTVMINSVEPHENVAFFVWTNLTGNQPNDNRHVYFNRAWWDDNGTGVVESNGGVIVDAANRAGYPTLGFDSERGQAIPTYHWMDSPADDAHPQLAWEWNLFPNIFNTYNVPDLGENISIWPRSQFAEYEGIRYLHMATSENRGDGDDERSSEMDILYSRSTYDEGQDVWIPGDQVLITEHGMNITVDLAVSYDGSRVALAQTVSRDYVLDPPDPEPTQHNNDLWIWISEDAGESWNEPIDLTHFIVPDPTFLPDDTLAADKDTLRAYADASVYFDHNNVLHVAYAAEGYFTYEETINFTSQIYHWDEESDVWTMAADGRFWNRALPEVWGRSCDRPNMYQDPESGILWMTYRQLGVPGDTLDDGFPADASDDSFGNYEVFLTASPPSTNAGEWYGKLWARGINITNTRGTTGGLLAGDCQSEVDPSIALNNDGDYLNLFYIKDLDGGFGCYSGDEAEGEITLNPMVYHRVLKDEMLIWFEEQAEWLPNYPMHVDSTQHWEDPLGYEWTDNWGFWRVGVAEGNDSELQPGEFKISSIYPNPFNPTTSISFSVAKYSKVNLAVYDVLGRKVADLVDRNMQIGQHEVLFHGDHLASGIYFVKLQAGSHSDMQKMMLIK